MMYFVALSIVIGAVAAFLALSPFPLPGFDYYNSLAFHGRAPQNAAKVRNLQACVNYVLGGRAQWTFGGKCVFIQTGPMEDFNDTVMFWVFLHVFKMLERTDANVYFCLSAGEVTPAERLAYLKSVFPQLASVEFGVKFGSVTFLADTFAFNTDMPLIDAYLNCGPSSTAVKMFVSANLRGPAVFVGTEPNGTASDGLNQRSTDTPGKLTPDHTNWNAFAASVPQFKVVGVEARYVFFPRFDVLEETEWAKVPKLYPKMEKSAWDTVRTFLVSRPGPKVPPAVAARINKANSVFVAQSFYKILQSVPQKHPAFRRGLNSALNYTNYNRTQFKEAVLPMVATSLFGGVYAAYYPGEVSCLTPESALVLDANLQLHCDHFTPAHDLIAVLSLL